MDNDPINKPGDEEEYSFIDDQDSPPQSMNRTSSAGIPPQSGSSSGGDGGGSGRKRLFIIIGAIIAIFCLYKLYGLFSTTPSKSSMVPTVPVVTASQNKSTATANVPANLLPPPTTAQSNYGDMDKRVTALEQAISGSGQAEENLQQQIAGLSTAMTSIQDNIATLTQQVTTQTQPQTQKTQPEAEASTQTTAQTGAETSAQTVTEAQAAATANLNAQKCVAPKKKSNVKKSARGRYGYYAYRNVNYYVKAMIQGRAWLITSDGATFTVSMGDYLPGYGRVEMIDPEKGVVMTSSGRVINYMPLDR